MNNSLKSNQWNQAPNVHQANTRAPPMLTPITNYTLPGVINYLTSEFTNLERFKIMTNLEKSEMKYRITQLQGEINSLKYINQEQQVKIEMLEKELSDKSGGSHTNNPTPTSKDNTKTQLDIPEVDLQVIKDARYQLTKSMRDMINLLRSPVGANVDYLELPDVDNSTSFDELFVNEKDQFDFNGYHKEDNSLNNPSAGVSSFFNTDNVDDTVGDDINQGLENEFNSLNLDEEKHPDSENPESDVETVVLDVENPSPPIQTQAQTPSPFDDSRTISLEAITVDRSVHNHSHRKVFNNSLNNLLIELNYTDGQEGGVIELYDIDNGTIVMTYPFKHELKDVDKILNVYCLDYDDINQIGVFLIIYENGDIDQVVLDEEDPLSSNILKHEDEKINSATLVRYDVKCSNDHKYYGLAITVDHKVKVYELTTGARYDLKIQEIGSFNKSFFKITSDELVLEIVKWIILSPTGDSAGSKKHHRTSSTNCDHVLSPYQLIVRCNNGLYLVNVYLKHFSTLTEYLNDVDFRLESDDASLVIANPVDESSSRLQIFDFTTITNIDKPKSPKPATVDLPESYNKHHLFTSTRYGDDFYIIELGEESLKMYDKSMGIVASKEATYNQVYRVKDYVVLVNGDLLVVYNVNRKI